MIQKNNTNANPDTPLIILTNNIHRFHEKDFTAEQLQYVKKELKDDKKTVAVNQYDRMVYVCVAGNSKKPIYIQKEEFRKAGHQMASVINKIKAKSVIIRADGLRDEVLCFTEGMALANYQFLKHKSGGKKNSLEVIALQAPKVSEADMQWLNTVVEATCKARDLVNEPVNFLSAVQLSDAFEKMGKEAGFKVKVLHKKDIEKLKMGGLLSVNLGSQDPPTFTVMEYKSPKAKNKKPFVLVGKGVVYDTGGLSLKPTANSMDYMKCDMGGSAAVSCALYAIAKAKLPVHVVALVPATDNRPGEKAYVPGDVITMYSGKTVEVLNTDAEGRLILADALHYAKQFNPSLVMEFSTLTGAASSALGKYAAAFMTTADNQKQAIMKSAENVFERIVEFPLWEEYGELLNSDIADLKNIGGPVAGMITAAKFLENFIDYPYMHFDIAGTAFVHAEDSYRSKGATGYGVRLIADFIKNKSK
ncbi:MAG: leucyl aminopeptidase [Bacteroidetes bacterium]|nr:leucyl aminopeptidase [Bacteroidota bacterium]